MRGSPPEGPASEFPAILVVGRELKIEADRFSGE